MIHSNTSNKTSKAVYIFQTDIKTDFKLKHIPIRLLHQSTSRFRNSNTLQRQYFFDLESEEVLFVNAFDAMFTMSYDMQNMPRQVVSAAIMTDCMPFFFQAP